MTRSSLMGACRERLAGKGFASVSGKDGKVFTKAEQAPNARTVVREGSWHGCKRRKEVDNPRFEGTEADRKNSVPEKTYRTGRDRRVARTGYRYRPGYQLLLHLRQFRRIGCGKAGAFGAGPFLLTEGIVRRDPVADKVSGKRREEAAPTCRRVDRWLATSGVQVAAGSFRGGSLHSLSIGKENELDLAESVAKHRNLVSRSFSDYSKAAICNSDLRSIGWSMFQRIFHPFPGALPHCSITCESRPVSYWPG